MSNVNTTNGAPVATITENELFQNFINGKRLARGKPIRELTFGFETEGLDEVFERLMDGCCDRRNTSDPSGDLESAAEELQGAVRNIYRLIEEFSAFKAEHMIDDDEAEPRYHVPTEASLDLDQLAGPTDTAPVNIPKGFAQELSDTFTGPVPEEYRVATGSFNDRHLRAAADGALAAFSTK